MLTVALLALSLSQGAAAQPSKLDQLAQPAAVAPQQISVVLDCQIAAKALTDCKAVNEVADLSRVAEAIRLAAGVAVPQDRRRTRPFRLQVSLIQPPRRAPRRGYILCNLPKNRNKRALTYFLLWLIFGTEVNAAGRGMEISLAPRLAGAGATV